MSFLSALNKFPRDKFQMFTCKRWVLLRHTGAPDDIAGIHFDLLLEEDNSCRTWRLNQIPNSKSLKVEAIRLPNHNLRWLDIKESTLSRDRGHVMRIDGGIYKGSLPREEGILIQLEIHGNHLGGTLEIKNKTCRIL